jgi:hypothetical protein
MGITGEASQNGQRLIGAGLSLSRSNSVGIPLLFFESLALFNLVSQDLNHPLPADLLESAPEADQIFDVHHPQHLGERIHRLAIFISGFIWFLFLFFYLHNVPSLFAERFRT